MFAMLDGGKLSHMQHQGWHNRTKADGQNKCPALPFVLTCLFWGGKHTNSAQSRIVRFAKQDILNHMLGL